MKLGPIDPSDPALEVIHSLPPRADKLSLSIAKMFGAKQVGTVNGVELTYYNFRGRSLFAGWKYVGGYFEQ